MKVCLDDEQTLFDVGVNSVLLNFEKIKIASALGTFKIAQNWFYKEFLTKNCKKSRIFLDENVYGVAVSKTMVLALSKFV